MLQKIRSQLVFNWLAPIIKEWMLRSYELQRQWVLRVYFRSFHPGLREDTNRNGYVRRQTWYPGTDWRYTLALEWLWMDEPLDSIVDWKRRWEFDVDLVGWVFLNL